ncbi:hypothetical protein CRG98_029172, partial [Punica granatum]
MGIAQIRLAPPLSSPDSFDPLAPDLLLKNISFFVLYPLQKKLRLRRLLLCPLSQTFLAGPSSVTLSDSLGSTAIGLKTKDGVVLAVEKRITSPLL